MSGIVGKKVKITKQSLLIKGFHSNGRGGAWADISIYGINRKRTKRNKIRVVKFKVAWVGWHSHLWGKWMTSFILLEGREGYWGRKRNCIIRRQAEGEDAQTHREETCVVFSHYVAGTDQSSFWLGCFLLGYLPTSMLLFLLEFSQELNSSSLV